MFIIGNYFLEKLNFCFYFLKKITIFDLQKEKIKKNTPDLMTEFEKSLSI